MVIPRRTMVIRYSVVIVICCVVRWAHCLCRPGVSCSLPDCQCRQTSAPAGLTRRDIPQIVLFTFDDAVRSKELAYYNRLFRADRLNPNGCPIRMTMFLQDSNTEYGAVRTLYRRGMEVAVHSVTHKSPQSLWRTMSEADLRREVHGQKLNIHRKAGVPLEKIRGWRSPFLQPTGDLQFKVLSDPEYGFTYDSSLATEKRQLSEQGFWPFTLDFGAGSHCGTPPCPRSSYPGLWEFLVTPLIDNENFPRIYVDSYRPANATESYRYLTRNFESHYHGTRSPFMINMHAAWFAYPHNLEAMDMFINNLLTNSDVYIITIQQAIEWLRAPVGLTSVRDFKAWGCDSSSLERGRGVAPKAHQPNTLPPPTTVRAETLGPLCVQNVNCKLPTCRCGNSGNPGNIADNKIPQMVLFTFDDNVNGQNIELYDQLFPKWRQNPNGSPVAMTLFLSDKSTDYDLVRQLYDRGMEVAVHSSMHTSNAWFWLNASPDALQREIVTQKNNIFSRAGIPKESIRGWRSPFLQPSGDRLFRILEQNGFTYDSTLTVSKKSLKARTDWPFTLDYGWNNACLTEPCPEAKYPGFWVVPVVNMLNPVTGLPCRYVDSCLPGNKSSALDYLWTNFQSHYTGNRAPFMLNMHMSWFQLNPGYFEAVSEFIDSLNKLSDVYIVTVQQALQWLKSPTEISAIGSFSPWMKQNEKARATDLDLKPDYSNNSTGKPAIPNGLGPSVVENGETDWVVIVLVVIASIFGVCIVITIGMHIIRKCQLQIRANSIREAMTVTSDRNSVTDWLNAFPRRPSQLSCPTTENFESQKHGFDYDNINFDMEGERGSSTDIRVKKLIPTNSLTLNPELLETNYTRDIAIWNQQEKKIPHILHKSQKRKHKDGNHINSVGLQAEDVRANAKLRATKKQEANSHKPWAFVWDPCKSQAHSESVLKSVPHKRGRSSSDYLESLSNKTPSKRPNSTAEDVALRRDVRANKIKRSGHYDFQHGEANSDCSGSEVSPRTRSFRADGPRYTRHSSGVDSSEASTCVTVLEKALDSPTTSHQRPRTPDRCMPGKVKSSTRHSRSSADDKSERHRNPRHRRSFHNSKENLDVRRRAESFDRTDVRRHDKSRDKRTARRSSDLCDSKARSPRHSDAVSGEQDPRITNEIEAEWERELRKQLDKFLKSKNGLRALGNYR